MRLDAPRVEADPAFAATLAAWASATVVEPVRRPVRSRLAVAAAGLAMAVTTLTAAYAVSDLRTPAVPDAPPVTHDRGPEPAPLPATTTPDPERVERGTPERRKRAHRVTPPAVAAHPETRVVPPATVPAAPANQAPAPATARPQRHPAAPMTSAGPDDEATTPVQDDSADTGGDTDPTSEGSGDPAGDPATVTGDTPSDSGSASSSTPDDLVSSGD